MNSLSQAIRHGLSEFVVNGLTLWESKSFRLLCIYLVAMVMMLTLGRAFRTEGMEFFHRLGMWLVICLLIIVQAVGLLSLLQRHVPSWLASGLGLSVTTLLLALQLDLLKSTPLLPKQPDPYWEFVLFLAPPVLFIGGGAMLILIWSANVRAKLVADHPPSSILKVQAQEHYLRITTRDGAEMKRARMQDFVSQLPAESGMRVHRSWWVAKEMIQSVRREGRDYRLILTDQTSVPVARSRVPSLRSAGWL